MSLLLNSVTAPGEWDFDPRSIPDCDIWFDAADTNTITGTSPVTAWKNKGNIVMNAVNDVGTCASATGTINGRNFIRCPQGTSLAFTCALPVQDRSIFLVIRAHQQLTTQFFAPIFRGTASTSQFLVLFSRASSTSYHYNLAIGNGLGTKLNAQSVYGASPGTFSGLVNPVPNSFNTTTVYGFVNANLSPATINCVSVNGSEYRSSSQPTSLTTSVAASGYDTGNIKYLINNSDSSATYNTGMDCCEILYYSRAIGDPERRAIEGYLAWKWGVVKEDVAVTPLSVPSCLAWYDADVDYADATSRATSFTFSSGDIVQTWKDKSGNGYTATALTTRETLTQNLVNGKCGVVFGGTGGVAALTSALSLGTTQSFTMFTVGYGVSFGGVRGCVVVNGYPGTVGGYLALQHSIANPGIWGWTGGTGFDGFTTGVPLGVSRPDVVSAIWTPGSCQQTVNGLKQPVSTTTPTTLTSGGQLLIGGLASSTTIANNWAGGILEIIVYDGVLSEDNRLLIERYLALKWNISNYVGTLTRYHPARFWRTFNRYINPLEQTTCTLWLDGADLSTITLVSSVVSQWNDKSGNGYNSTQPTAGNRPTYANNLLTFASDRCLQLNQSALNNSTGSFAIFFVFNPTSSSNWIMTKQFDGVDTTNVLSTTIYSDGSGGIQTGGANYVYFKTSNSRTIANSGPNTVSTSTLQVIALVCNPSGTLTMYKNGTLMSTTSGVFTVTDNIAANYCTLGALIAGGTFFQSGVTNFSLGEMLIYNSTPTLPYGVYYGFTTGFRQRIEGYLAWKWGLQASLPSTHPFYPSRLRPDSYVAHPLQTQNSATFDVMLWLDASDPYGNGVLPASGTAIAQWVDKSANAKTCVQNVASQRPTFTYDNGYPAISFSSASSQYLQANGAVLSGSAYNSYTIFIVFRVPTAVANNTLFFLPRTALSTALASAIYQVIRTDANTTNLQVFTRYNATTTKTRTFTPQTGNYIVSIPDSGLANTNSIVFYNGTDAGVNTLAGTTALATSDSGNSRYLVGAQCFSSVYANYATAFVNEILVFRRQLGAPERQRIEGYLAWKWGQQNNLPTTHAYRTSKP